MLGHTPWEVKGNHANQLKIVLLQLMSHWYEKCSHQTRHKLTEKIWHFYCYFEFDLLESMKSGEYSGFSGNGLVKLRRCACSAGCPRRLLWEATIAGIRVFIKKPKIKSKHRLHDQKFSHLRKLNDWEYSVFRLEFIGLSWSKENQEKSDSPDRSTGLKGESKKLVGHFPLGWSKIAFLSGDHHEPKNRPFSMSETAGWNIPVQAAVLGFWLNEASNRGITISWLHINMDEANMQCIQWW